MNFQLLIPQCSSVANSSVVVYSWAAYKVNGHPYIVMLIKIVLSDLLLTNIQQFCKLNQINFEIILQQIVITMVNSLLFSD